MKRTYSSREIALLLYAKQELEKLEAEAKMSEGFKSFGTVAECPCGCGLKRAICDEQCKRIQAAHDEMPF